MVSQSVSVSDFLSLFLCGLALFWTDLVTNYSYGMTYSILIHRSIVVTDAKFKRCSFAGNVYLVLFICVGVVYVPPLRIYLWWSLCTLYLHACHVRVTVGDSGQCYRVRVTSFER